MPYASVSELPEHVKKYTDKIQRQWRHVFNTVYNNTNSESRAFKAANSVLKKRFKKGQNATKESHNDYFNQLIDSWLGKLEG